MTAILGIALLLLVVGIWAYAERHDLDPFGEDDDDSGYSDPGKLPRQLPPQTSGVGIPIDRSIPRRGVAGDLEESGYQTTYLKRVK